MWNRGRIVAGCYTKRYLSKLWGVSYGLYSLVSDCDRMRKYECVLVVCPWGLIQLVVRRVDTSLLVLLLLIWIVADLDVPSDEVRKKFGMKKWINKWIPWHERQDTERIFIYTYILGLFIYPSHFVINVDCYIWIFSISILWNIWKLACYCGSVLSQFWCNVMFCFMLL